jgi:hypothetical protein
MDPQATQQSCQALESAAAQARAEAQDQKQQIDTATELLQIAEGAHSCAQYTAPFGKCTQITPPQQLLHVPCLSLIRVFPCFRHAAKAAAAAG